jgi:uncharacterized membrane protein YoaK (UPF0700 family)
VKISIPDTLTLNGGYVDTAGFLALQGLFTAHVTGNFVTLGASLAQKAIHRLYFPKAPPTTLMTGSTTQIMIDIGDLLCGELTPDVRSATWHRCVRLARSVCIFALGCGISALVYARLGTAVFIAPPLIAALAFLPPLRQMRGPSVA